MNINGHYKELYEGEALKARRKALFEYTKSAQKRFDEMVKAEQKRRQPRKRVNFEPLEDEWYDNLKQQFISEYDHEAEHEAIMKAEDARKDQLYDLAPKVNFKGDPFFWWMVKESWESTYRSQGWGSASYTKAALKPLEYKLNQFGLITKIVKSRWGFQLWANCPEWMADAAERQITFTDISKAVGRTVNVCALYPGLPVEYLDKHYEIAK